MSSIRHLLQDIFNSDFTDALAKAVKSRFFKKKLTLADLQKVSAFLCASHTKMAGKDIPASLLIKGKTAKAPFVVLAQLHGNEPAGLAGILLVMALSESGNLKHDVIVVVGNPLAATQYFKAWEENPRARQETRDAYRCGLAEDGSLLPDMNRIPIDFMKRAADTHHIRRAQELFTLAQNSCGVLDIHTARGDMVCITDHKYDRDLKHASIRSVLMELADAISANASSAGSTLVTFKTLVSPLPNIEHQVGIEAGKHEAQDAPQNAAAFTLSLLHRIGYTDVEPTSNAKDNGKFDGYFVKPRITYADLEGSSAVEPDDTIYMAMKLSTPEEMPADTSQVVVRRKGGKYGLQTALEYIVAPAGMLCYALCQYEEMRPVKKGQVLAVAIPSGAELKAPDDFSGIFWSKWGKLYDKDPTVGPWPLPAGKAASTKLCYPCKVEKMTLKFD